MTNTYRLKILAIVERGEGGLYALEHALFLSRALKKSLILLHEDEECQILRQINRYGIINPEEEIKYITLDIITAKEIIKISKKTDAGILLISNKIFKANKILKLINRLNAPCMVVKDNNREKYTFKDIICPLDASRVTKEKLLWAVFFGKFNQSKIHILSSVYEDEYFLRSKANRVFAKKIMKKFGISYEFHKPATSSFELKRASIKYAKRINAEMSIIMTTKNYNLIDHMFGPQELKIIRSEEKLPVLFLNSRDDLYIPCV